MGGSKKWLKSLVGLKSSKKALPSKKEDDLQQEKAPGERSKFWHRKNHSRDKTKVSTGIFSQYGSLKEEKAAICIQTEFRAFLAAEAKAKSMETELQQLQESLEKKSSEVQTSASVVEQYLRELVDVRTTLAKTQESADASAVSAQSVQFQCSALLKELDKKNNLLQEHENRVTRLGQQLDELQQDLKSREISQRHLKEEVLKIEQEIKFAVAKAGANKDCEFRKLLDEVSAKNFENLAKHLSTKEEEIARLREEIKIMSAQWKQKTQELEAQLEKQRRADQELKKRVLKLEFCLQEARSQTRKLQRERIYYAV